MTPHPERCEPRILGPAWLGGSVGAFWALDQGLSECEEVGWLS